KKIRADGLGFRERSSPRRKSMAGNGGKDAKSRKQVGGRAGGVGDYSPVFGRGHIQREAGLKIRLVKTRKRHAGVHGHKQAVNILSAVVLIFESRNSLTCRRDRREEVHGDGVFARAEEFLGQGDVRVFDFGGRVCAGDFFCVVHLFA